MSRRGPSQIGPRRERFAVRADSHSHETHRLTLVLVLGAIAPSRIASTQAVPPSARSYIFAGDPVALLDAEIAIANPHETPVLVTLTFFAEDATTVTLDVTLPPA